uniref:PINc domain-containing protein n=1 Tax=Anopheles melas TaxID=34690 RepID=A0A182TZG6_9DIPT
MSSKRKEAPPTTPETPRQAKRMRSPEWQGANRWKANSPSDGPSFKAATPQSKIAHRLSPSFQSPKPGTPVTVTTSALDTKQTKVANEGKTGRIATIPSKLPNTASVSSKADKTLSTIVKAKNKKAKGLPEAWRAELYGTRPGSAQARLEQLCTALHQEPKKAEKQKETNNDSQKAMSDLKTKYKEGLSAFSSYFYCVIDTNIFIEHYQDFQSFLSKKYKGRQPIVIIPYKVLHELDTVKHKKPQLASKIVPVVKFLHKMLRAKDARVKGQHPWDDTIELMPLLSPDDSIVNCALQVQTVAGDAQVVLVSNDCNMLTKALVANLNSCTMEELQSDYNF